MAQTGQCLGNIGKTTGNIGKNNGHNGNNGKGVNISQEMIRFGDQPWDKLVGRVVGL